MKQNKFYITTPIYYVNAKPHIGHAYTTIAADILARYQRLIGSDVFFLTGTDEHGKKNAEIAEEQGKTPQIFVDEMSAFFKSCWDALNISNDDFIRTTEKRHITGVKQFLLKLKENNAVYEGRYEGYYCIACENFIRDSELVEGKCPIHHQSPEKISEKNYFFKLEDYIGKVEEMIRKGELRILPKIAENETLGLIRQKLENFSISREKVKWGITLPWDKNQTVYVWVDALINYLTGLGYGTSEKKFKKFWPADLHLIGRDILKFHAIFWPALLLAVKLPLPRVIFAHGFFTINGQKMSKTLGNVIDPNELIREYGSDGARYLIISQFPFGQDGDIKAENFSKQYNANLANNLGNLVSRTLTLADKYKITKAISDQEMAREVKKTWGKIEKAMLEFRIDRGLVSIWELINFSNKYIDERKPWQQLNQKLEIKNQKLDMVIYSLLETLRNIAWMISFFLPETSRKIFVQLNVWDQEKKKSFKELKKWGGLLLPIKAKRGENLFPRA